MGNLNNNLYKRFGLEMQVEKVQKGFLRFSRNTIDSTLGPIRYPLGYQDSSELSVIQRNVLNISCRQMFLDSEKFPHSDYGFGEFLDEIFIVGFQEVLVRLQIFINVVYKQKILILNLKSLSMK